MTSAPVKDVSSLMNFIGGGNLTKTGGMNQTGSFGDVMSKTWSGSSQKQDQMAAAKQSQNTSGCALQRQGEARRVQKPAEETVKTEELTTDQQQAVDEAVKEVVQEVAKELDVTPEEVERAMAELGLSVYSLMNPADLTQLVLFLSGEQDMSALLTEESLFASLQKLLAAAAEIKQGLMQEMGMTPQQLQALLEEAAGNPMKAQEAEGMIQNAEQTVKAQQENVPELTVEVKAAGEEIKLNLDEKGNVTGTAEVIPSKEEGTMADQMADSQSRSSQEGKGGQSESMLHTGNQLLDALLQNRTAAVEGTFEQTATFFSEQTQDIMNQIMDYMKIQLKPGTEQLEMQLHPESLGTVHVQLTNKGGEITALFQVQNETVKAAIESQIAALQENFKEQGVKVQAVQVTVENHGFESNLWQGQGKEEDASSQNSRKAPRRINLNDLSGLPEEGMTEEEEVIARMMEVNGNTVDYTA